MICEQQKPASGLDAANPLSPPPTPGHNNKNFPNNFLTPSQENFCSTTVVNSATDTATTHDTIHATETGSAITPSEAADLQFNFNIPNIISAELKSSRDTQEAKGSQNSLSSPSPFLNHFQELHLSTSQSHSHPYPSPVSSPEESDQSIQVFLGASPALHSPASASPHNQQSHEQQSYFQYHHLHHHHHHRDHHRLNHPNTFPVDTPQKQSEEIQSIKKLLLDTSASYVDHTTHHRVNHSNQNNLSNKNNSPKITGSDFRDILTTQVTTTHYPFHKESGPKRLNFDMSQSDVTTDITTTTNSSNPSFHMVATTKNNDNNTHDYTHEVDNVLLPWTYLLSACEEPASNINTSDQSDFLTHQFPFCEELNAIMSDDVHMTDNCSTTECDITDLKDVADIYELEHLSDIMNTAASYNMPPSEFLSLTEFYQTDSSGSSSGDDFSEGDYKDSQHLQTLEVNSSFSNQLFNNPAHFGDNDHPHSPSNSDEGFVDCAPPLERDHVPLGGKQLPFDGKFPEAEDSEASSATDSKKRPRKRQSSLKLKRKIAASPPGERRKPGRKPGQVSNVLHLWEFMRDLLHDPKFSGIIEWICKIDGVFRVLNSAEVARLWGEKKNNKKAMTYEKLSRSLRYSRLEGYFDNLPKNKNYPKKLCFKFGPKSKNWSLR